MRDSNKLPVSSRTFLDPLLSSQAGSSQPSVIPDQISAEPQSHTSRHWSPSQSSSNLASENVQCLSPDLPVSPGQQGLGATAVFTGSQACPNSPASNSLPSRAASLGPGFERQSQPHQGHTPTDFQASPQQSQQPDSSASANLSLLISSTSGVYSHGLQPHDNVQSLSSPAPASVGSQHLSADSIAARDQDSSAGNPSSVEDTTELKDARHLESPGKFAEAQLALMQLRQQQLLSQRLAALPPLPGLDTALSMQHPLPRQPLQQRSSPEQDSSPSGSLLPVLASRIRPLSKGAQHAGQNGEGVANSPVVLFSPGGPYSENSSWYNSSAAAKQVLT